jgi:hypothetical protein
VENLKRMKKLEELPESPGPALGGAMNPSVLFKLLVGGRAVAGQRPLDRLKFKGPSQLSVTEVSGILVGDLLLGERLIGDCESELAIL